MTDNCKICLFDTGTEVEATVTLNWGYRLGKDSFDVTMPLCREHGNEMRDIEDLDFQFIEQ